MKRSIFLVVISFFFLEVAIAQQFIPQHTGLIPDGSSSPFHMVAVDQNTLWSSISGPELDQWDKVPNILVHTGNGGMTWETYTIPTVTPDEFYIACISAVGQDSVWVSCIDSLYGSYQEWGFLVYASFDGGLSWNLQDVPFSDTMSYGGQIHFFDHLEGIIFAGSADGYFQVFKTYNGGDEWERIPSQNLPPIIGNNEFDIDDGYYAIEDTIWVGTNRSRVLKSIDRGTTWMAYDTPAPANSTIFEISFSDSQNGIARYDLNKLLLTTDGGENWENLVPIVLPISNIFDLNSVPGQAGHYLCSGYSDEPLNNNKLFFSSDNGFTWSELEQVNLPGRIAMANADYGWISEIDSDTETVDLYRVESLTSHVVQVEEVEPDVFPNPFVSELEITIDHNLNIESIEITDSSGKIFQTLKIDNRTGQSIILKDLGSLPGGVYYISINTEEGTFTKKIVKMH